MLWCSRIHNDRCPMGNAAPPFFYRPVNSRSRTRMVDFLSQHFRYDTMNGWNRATSYAHCVKLANLGMVASDYDKAYDVLQTDMACLAWRPVIHKFAEAQAGRATIDFNGRSNGYLVLYESQYRNSEHRSYCTACGQRNFQVATPENCQCGVCRSMSRVNYAVPPRELVTMPGQGIDTSEDFVDWPRWRLRERVRLVQAFDRACDRVRANFIDMIHRYDVVDHDYVVVKQRKVLVKRSLAAQP